MLQISELEYNSSFCFVHPLSILIGKMLTSEDRMRSRFGCAIMDDGNSLSISNRDYFSEKAN